MTARPESALRLEAVATVLGTLVVLGVAVVRSARRHDAAPELAAIVHRIDLDRATAAELGLLPGIGPRLAARIVAHREVHGAFGGAEGLERVPGIGGRTVARLRPLLMEHERP